MEENKPQEGEPVGGEGEGKPENIAQLASEHIPKEVATTPSGLRLGGRPLVHSIHGTVFVLFASKSKYSSWRILL